ncbi:uracil-DNA glycosylase [Fusibacter ferrireducens]|uniref:Uracil-DNA glycosylase n=1 Tax=Fusibacter ferrireducens TaxID=2785058 RepID=A0ABR9ZRT9_9FIRM|nr:uracil-DNA glycosylase [Fusibacter ferrireducens]MBF4693173.1 uracil-DNA glycosylase [Fusibacter ferrireducens]
MKKIFENDWQELLSPEFEKDYYQHLRQFLIHEYRTQKIYPLKEDLYNAFRLTAYKEVKVVILGQDPYHGAGQAHGLCFSVLKGVKTPPSLVNIYKELARDLGCKIPTHGNLTAWAEQGVLLLNTVLTVRAGEANSHRQKGWETFTDSVIALLNNREEPIIFMLWGNPAQTKIKLITKPQHLILKSTHPSPLSAHRGFLGCGHFSKANAFLESRGLTPINWQIE